MAEKAESSENQEKYFEDQLDGEEVQFVFRKHPVVMRKGLVYGMLGPLIGVVPAAIYPQLGFGWFFGGLGIGTLLGALIMMPYWINWYYSIFIVTDKRLIQITRKGLFTKGYADMGLDQIQSLNYQIKGFQATLLGYGTLLVQTYMGNMVVNNVHQPTKVYKQLVATMQEQGVHPHRLANKDNVKNEIEEEPLEEDIDSEEIADAEEV